MLRLFLFSLLIISACDGGSKSDCPKSSPLTPELLAEYRRMEECTGMKADPPKVVWKKTVPCPTSGRMGCLEGKPYPCPQNKSELCLDSGEYSEECKVVILPDKDASSAAHEFVHSILHRTKGDADKNHKNPLFQKCG